MIEDLKRKLDAADELIHWLMADDKMKTALDNPALLNRVVAAQDAHEERWATRTV